MTDARGRGPSLKARAVALLSRREHSRQELVRKLQRHSEDAAQIEAVLDSLQQEGWLSETRYAESLLRKHTARQGTARIVQTLRRSGVDETFIRQARAGLQATEYERAWQVWHKRYGGKPAATPAEYARQARFLAARGFSAEVVGKILKRAGGAVDDMLADGPAD
ncbi:recombination regulator RecX [Orrella sp. JC864]|uniref:recombination regulator RecX n=1 Tax=Orrella sp. JC864 TaxID=3120298 RepID=UPI0012BCEF60